MTSGPFPVNSSVEHPEWGRGLVVGREDDRIVVLFDSVGYKTISLDLANERQLLRPVP